jgi:dTDP-4-dehydrorhamnose 3,5-epimerase
MERIDTPLAGLCLLKPRVFGDARGFFIESWNARTFTGVGLDLHFVQDNHSRSGAGVLRGLHYQLSQPQGKLVRVSRGRAFDVAVDIRADSQTYGQWYGAELSDVNHHMLWVPPGFAHGYLALSEVVDFQYKCTAYYAPADEHSILWNDPAIGIDWPLGDTEAPLLSDKDAQAPTLAEAEVYPVAAALTQNRP